MTGFETQHEVNLLFARLTSIVATVDLGDKICLVLLVSLDARHLQGLGWISFILELLPKFSCDLSVLQQAFLRQSIWFNIEVLSYFFILIRIEHELTPVVIKLVSDCLEGLVKLQILRSLKYHDLLLLYLFEWLDSRPEKRLATRPLHLLLNGAAFRFRCILRTRYPGDW